MKSKKPNLTEKNILTRSEAVSLFRLNARKFNAFLESTKQLPFTGKFRTRTIIIREELEAYLRKHPEVEEEIGCGRT